MSSSVKNGGRSGPSATRAAPVRVANVSIMSGLSSSASAIASASTSRPSASVLPISTVKPARDLITSCGRNAFPATLFSADAISTRRRTGRFAHMIMCAAARTAAAPPISFFMISIADDGLRSNPPVSNAIPLPINVIFGNPPWCPVGCHVRSISRGARGEARPTAWMSGKFCASRSSPTMLETVASCTLASARTASSISAGPMSLAGVLIRSRPKAVPSTIAATR